MVRFKVGDEEYEAKMPNRSALNEADLKYTAAVNRALKEGIMSTQECVDLIKERKMWSDEDEKNHGLYREEMNKKVDLLDNIEDKGEGRKIAREIKELRMKIFQLNSKINSVLSNSAEEYGNRIKEDYLTSQCIYKDGKKKFSSYEEYLEAEALLQLVCKQKTVAMLNGVDDNLALNFPESKYLIKNGLMTEDGIEVDPETGFRIDPLTGLFVDDDYDFVDKDGNKIDEYGNKVGNSEKAVGKKKRGRKKKTE